MRRAILTLGGTAAGLAALLSFKTHSLAEAAPAVPSTPAASASMTPSMTGQTGSGSTDGKGGGKMSASPKAGTSSPAAARTVTGTVANTQHGPMQLQLTLDGSKITKVTVLQQTNDGPMSVSIDATAIPKLTSETLAAQNADIDTVSGATYTSTGYIQSLQSALDKAGI